MGFILGFIVNIMGLLLLFIHPGPRHLDSPRPGPYGHTFVWEPVAIQPVPR